MFTKTDLAKYLFAWNQCPHIVSLGNDYCFRKLTLNLAEEKAFSPDETYFKALIGKAILFRETTKIVSDMGFKAYKANIVAYTIALLSLATDGRVDLEKIWERQALSKSMRLYVESVARIVEKELRATAEERMPSQWAKKAACWDSLRGLVDKVDVKVLSEDVGAIPTITELHATEPGGSFPEVVLVTAAQWFEAAKYFTEIDDQSSDWYCKFLGSVGSTVARGKPLSVKQQRYCQKALDILREHGKCL